MNWLVGFRMVVDGSMVILGFYVNEFVVWSFRSYEKLYIINCGGGYRFWVFFDIEAVMVFVYFKDGDVMLYRVLGGCIRLYVIFRESLYGREIICVKRVGIIILGFEFGVFNFMQFDYFDFSSEGFGLIDIVIICSEDIIVCVLVFFIVIGLVYVFIVVCNYIFSVRVVVVWGIGILGGFQDFRLGLIVYVVFAGGRVEIYCFSIMVILDFSILSRFVCYVMYFSFYRLDEYWDRQRNRYRMVKVDLEIR